MLNLTREFCPDRPLIHPTSRTRDCRFDRCVGIGDHCVLEEAEMRDYTYCFDSSDIIYTTLGRFNSIATGVRVNLVQHPAKIRAVTYHFTYRCSHYGLRPDDAALIDWRRRNHRVVTGSDVWLEHDVVLMGGVTLDDGVVADAGAVVTHDVALYKIVGGVSARYVGWRYSPGLTTAIEHIR